MTTVQRLNSISDFSINNFTLMRIFTYHLSMIFRVFNDFMVQIYTTYIYVGQQQRSKYSIKLLILVIFRMSTRAGGVSS